MGAKIPEMVPMSLNPPKPPPQNAGKLEHWKCEYCDAVNANGYFKCHNCGASRKEPNPPTSPPARIINEDSRDSTKPVFPPNTLHRG